MRLHPEEVAAYGLCELGPVKTLAEAVVERAAAVGAIVPIMLVKTTDVPCATIYKSISESIKALLPYYIKMDLSQFSRDFVDMNANDYRSTQYVGFPVKFLKQEATRAGTNVDRFPQLMENYQSSLSSTGSDEILAELQDWYRACVFMLESMYAVDVTALAQISNVWSCNAEWGIETEEDETRWYYAEVNGNAISTVYKQPAAFFQSNLSSVSNTYRVDRRRQLGDIQSSFTFRYQCTHWIGYVSLTGDPDVEEGEKTDDLATFHKSYYPGTVRFQNPSALPGDLHVVAKWTGDNSSPKHIMHDYTHVDILQSHTDPRPSGHPYLIVDEDLATRSTWWGYHLMTGGLFDSSLWSIKYLNDKPGHEPLQDDTETTTYFFNYPNGQPIEGKSKTTRDPYRQYPAGDVEKYDEYWIVDGGGVWTSPGVHDVSLGPMQSYEILDKTLFHNVNNSGWVDYTEFFSYKPPEMPYYDFYRDSRITINGSMRYAAYIDYTRSFHYKRGTPST